MNKFDGMVSGKGDVPESYTIQSPEDVKPPINEDAKDVLELAMEGARENFRRDCSCSPCIILAGGGELVDGKKRVDIVGFKEFTDETKNQVGQFLVEAQRHRDASALICESWMAAMPQGTTNEDIRSGNYVRASQIPNRIECVIINLKDLTRSVMVVAEIKRPDGAKPILDDWKVLFDTLKNGCQLEGRLAG